MTLQNLEFFVEIAKDLNLSKTADRLFTTQQNLSSHIKRLEEEYNTVFLIRKPTVALTEDGKLLLKAANSILNTDRQLRLDLDTANYPEKQFANIACYPWRLGDIIQEILFQTYAKFPAAQILFSPVTSHSSLALGPRTEIVEEILEDKNITFALGTWENETKKLNCIPLFQSQSYFIIKRQFIEPYVKNVDRYIEKHKDGLEIKDIPDDVPIIRMTRNGTPMPLAFAYDVPSLRGHSNHLYIDAAAYEQAAYLCKNGQAGMFAPILHVKKYFKERPDDIVLFPIMVNNEKFILTYYLYYSTEQKLSPFCRDFVEIIKNVFSNVDTSF